MNRAPGLSFVARPLPQPPHDGKANPASAGFGRQVRILIIDDEKPIREMLLAYLQRSGLDLEIELAEDGLAGREAIRRFRPDLVILDLVMPGLNGAELCRWMRANGFTDTKVLLITGNPASGLLVQAMQAGADGWLKKPFALAELLGKTREMLASQVSRGANREP